MEKSAVDPRRRTVLAGGLVLCTAPLVGCAYAEWGAPDHSEATQPENPQPTRSDNSARKAFIERAMDDAQNETRQKLAALRRKGVTAVMQASVVIPFGDADYYYVKGGPIRWEPNPGQSFQSVEVPEGFVTDLASIPPMFWYRVRPEGRHAYAAVVHDYLYWTQSRPRDEADRIFDFAMQDSDVTEATRWALYQAVDKLGGWAWNNNRRLKARGERRMLARYPPNLLISWEDWKKTPSNFK